MRLARSDLRQLRIPLVAALLLAGIGVAAVVYAEAGRARAERLYKDVRQQLVSAKERLAKVSEEEQAIRNNLAQFGKFESLRMTGGERRLEWIEAITAARERHRLFEVKYTLEPRGDVAYPGMAQYKTGAGSIFMVSSLKLDMALLHEEDLLNFLADLRTTVGSFATLRSCSILRTERAFSGGGPLRPRMRANCVMDMITLRQQENT